MDNRWQIEASILTDQGQVRDHNEDFVDWRVPADALDSEARGWLIIVADGVGGSDAGEVASRFATERTLYHYLNDVDSKESGERLVDAIQKANNDLRQLKAEQEHGSRMATTMVALVIKGNQASMANVGDSRGYHWRDGTLRQITKDHSLVARLVEEGVITEEEAEDHPRKNVILHSLGSENPAQVDLFELAMEDTEQIVLCSDGLTRHVKDNEIARVIGECDPAEATKKLIEMANKRGGEDNISVAVVRFWEHSTEPENILESDSEPLLEAESAGTEVILELGRFYQLVLALVVLVLVFLIKYLFVG
jgi:serine/threonine protein phosphatase PrpC